jgi:hypothetical protein
MKYWDEREEELFKKAWTSNAFEEEDLAEIFGRTVESLRKKADRLKLPRKRYLEQKARLDAIEKALKEAHVI